MKFFTVIFLVVAASSIAKADDDHSSCNGLAAVLGPLFKLLQPFLNGVNCGLQSGAKKIGSGVNDIGNTLQCAVSGLGSATTNTLSGVAGTVGALPAALCKTTEKLQTATGPILGSVLNTVTGGVSCSH